MARTITDLQKPTLNDFYRNIQNFASNTVTYEARLKQFVEFVGSLTVEDLDAIGVPAAGADFGLRTDLLNLRNSMQAIYDEMQLHDAILSVFRTMTTL